MVWTGSLKAVVTCSDAPQPAQSRKEPEIRRRAASRCQLPPLRCHRSRKRRQRWPQSKTEWPTEASEHLLYSKGRRHSVAGKNIILGSTHYTAGSSPHVTSNDTSKHRTLTGSHAAAARNAAQRRGHCPNSGERGRVAGGHGREAWPHPSGRSREVSCFQPGRRLPRE